MGRRRNRYILVIIRITLSMVRIEVVLGLLLGGGAPAYSAWEDVLPGVCSDVNKDWTCKDKDKDFTYSYLLQVAAKPTISTNQQQ